MEQNNKKTYDLRVEGNQIVLVGTSSDTLGQVLAFRAKISDDANATPPVRELVYEDIIISGMERELAEKLSLLVGSHLEPNYPDNPYVVRHAVLVPAPTSRGGNPYSRELPVDAIELANWAEQNDIAITGLTPIDRVRMSKVVEGEKTFELTVLDAGHAELRGITRDTLGMSVDVTYAVENGELLINSIRELADDHRSVGQYLLALGLFSAVKAGTAASNESVLVKARRGFYQYDFNLDMAAIIAVPQEDPDVYLIRPQFMILVQSALGDAGFRIRIKGERPTSGSDEDLPGWARNQQPNAGSDNGDSEAVDQ